MHIRSRDYQRGSGYLARTGATDLTRHHRTLLRRQPFCTTGYHIAQNLIKHSLYLIRHSELTGLEAERDGSPTSRAIIAARIPESVTTVRRVERSRPKYGEPVGNILRIGDA
jgi:hypothetical protein